MKRWLLALVFAALSAPSFSGTVSGTVNRPDGQPLANGTLPYTLSPTASTVARATAVTAAKFPTATIAQPSGHSLQSIARPLSLGSHDFFANAIRTTSPFYCQTNATGILFADCPIYSGADASCKIRNAIRALPGGPTAPVGIVDARNFTDVGGTGACVIDAGNGATTQTQNPVTVLLGGTTYNFSQIVLRSGFTMTGLGGYSSTGTTVQATSATTDLVVIPPGTAQPVTGVYLRGIRFLGVDGNHAETGMRIVASTGTGNGGGLWEAIFQDLTFLQFKGISIDFEATAGTTPLDRGLNQFLTLVQVRAYRVTGGSYGLQLLGADAQFDCFACQFQGPVMGDGVNVNISDSAPQAVFLVPNTIHFYETTTENANIAYTVAGCFDCRIQGHFENLNGAVQMNFHPGLWGTNVEVTGGYFALTGINKGRGYLVQMTDSTSSLIWNRNHIISTPDTLISNSAGGQVSSDSNFQAATAVMLDVPSPTAFLNTNYTNSTTSLTNVGDLNFPLAKSQAYAFRCELYYQAAATGGLQVGFSGPATNSFIYGVEIATDNGTGTPYNTGVGTALATKIPTASVAVAKAATNYVAHVSGSINPSAVGVLQLQGASAAAATLTVNRGSYCKLYSQSSFQ